MSITVMKNGNPVPNTVMFATMTPYVRTTKLVQHVVEGAEKDFIYYRGRNSAQQTLTGYCLRSKANEEILDGLADGSFLEITHSITGTRRYICTAVNPQASGSFIHFTLSLTEQ